MDWAGTVADRLKAALKEDPNYAPADDGPAPDAYDGLEHAGTVQLGTSNGVARNLDVWTDGIDDVAGVLYWDTGRPNECADEVSPENMEPRVVLLRFKPTVACEQPREGEIPGSEQDRFSFRVAGRHMVNTCFPMIGEELEAFISGMESAAVEKLSSAACAKSVDGTAVVKIVD